MPDDLKHYLPGLLTAAGVILQFLMRQFQTAKDRAYYPVAFGLALGAYALVTPLVGGHVRVWFLDFTDWLVVGGGLAMVCGGTFIASGAAKAIVARKPALANNPLVPLTNSK